MGGHFHNILFQKTGRETPKMNPGCTNCPEMGHSSALPALLVTIFHVLIHKTGQKYFPSNVTGFSGVGLQNRTCFYFMRVSIHQSIQSQAPIDVSHSVSGLKKQTPSETHMKSTCLLYLHRNCNCCIVVTKYQSIP